MDEEVLEKKSAFKSWTFSRTKVLPRSDASNICISVRKEVLGSAQNELAHRIIPSWQQNEALVKQAFQLSNQSLLHVEKFWSSILEIYRLSLQENKSES